MAEVRFPVTVGVGLRRQFKRAVKKMCWEREYPYVIDEDKGVFETVMYVRIEVPDHEASAFKAVLEDWFDYLNQL